MKGMKYKPICIVNIDGYYDGFVIQMKKSFEEGLLYDEIDKYFFVADDVVSGKIIINMNVYMYIYIYTYIYIYIHIYIYVGLDWCEKQYELHKYELSLDQDSRAALGMWTYICIHICYAYEHMHKYAICTRIYT
jgi:hypothetical protein